jgi:hypothetical protein
MPIQMRRHVHSMIEDYEEVSPWWIATRCWKVGQDPDGNC